MGRTEKPTMAHKHHGSASREKGTQLLHDLELKHRQNASESELLVRDEESRRLRVRILLLRDENASLQERVDLNTGTNTVLATRCDDLQGQIEAKIATVRSQEEQLRKQEREYTNLKAELQCMNEVHESSANVLSEKLALSRELANLKPELEHLRSQVNHQQAVLTEKLALERQVNTLEVELANEKKATKRAMKSRESNDRVEDELRKKLRAIEKKLTAETAERERLEDQLEQKTRAHAIALQDQDSTRELEADLRKKLQEAQRQLREEIAEKESLGEELKNAQRASKKLQQNAADSQAEAEVRARLEEAEKNLATAREESASHKQQHQTAIDELEKRNEQLEKKLKNTQTKLRVAQEELTKTQIELRKALKQAPPSSTEDITKPAAKTLAARKRKAHETSTGDFTNIEIPTPSADVATKARRIPKKPAFEPSLVGEKSTFSITPFLNRSKGMSTSEDAEGEEESVLEDSMLGPDSESSNLAAARAAAELVTEPAEAEPANSDLPGAEKPKAVPKARGRPKKILAESTSTKKNSLAKQIAKKVLKSKNSLEKVAEAAEPGETQENNTTTEGEEKQQQPEEKKATVKFDLAAPPPPRKESAAANEEPPKKKKRKVLGSTKTLFDEDEGVGVGVGEGEGEGETPAPKKPAKVQPGAKRTTKAPLAIQRTSAFASTATFSPLKRDRRGVAASFLA